MSQSQNVAIRLLPLIDFLKPYRLRIVGALIALSFTAAVMLSIGQGLKYVVDAGFATESEGQLEQTLAAFFILTFLLAIGTFTRFYLVSWLGERVTTDIREKVFNHVIDLHPSYFETNLSGEIQSRLTTDTTVLQTVIGSSVSIALRNILMLVGGVILMFVTNIKLAFIILLSVPFIVVPVIIIGRKVRTLSRHSQDRIADVGTYVGETLQNIKTVHAYNHQEVDKQVFSDYAELAFQVALRRIKHRAILITVVIVLVLGGIGAMFWVGSQDVMSGEVSPGELAAFVFYAIIVAGAMGAVSEVYGELQRAAGATERLIELLNTQSVLLEPSDPSGFVDGNRGQISIKNLNFYYNSRPEVAALNNVSLNIAAGESVAIVGPSGAGKSTLFDLLLRFYDPQDGVIELDGVDVRQVKLKALRDRIAIVSQQPSLFTGNVMENIRYSRLDATDEQVKQAAQAAFADEFIQSLPAGYNTYLGEGGVRLSGGQRQRIAIARALLKDPDILLLDEATSALDAESEHMVQQALDKVMEGRTTLIIAHRLATVKHVDRILLFDGGQLLAAGNHRSLMNHSPLYARLANLQFQQGPDRGQEDELEHEWESQRESDQENYGVS